MKFTVTKYQSWSILLSILTGVSSIPADISSSISSTSLETNGTMTGPALLHDPRIICINDNSCGTDTSCIAKCFNVPDPSVQQVADTLSCYNECPKQTSDIITMQTIIDCQQNCSLKYFDSSSSNSKSSSSNSNSNSTNTGNGSSKTNGVLLQSFGPSVAVMSIALLASGFSLLI